MTILGSVAGRIRALRREMDRRRLERRLAGPQILRALAREERPVFFVEIGSNDGDQHDHLRDFVLRHPWRGIMVEPVPYIFERLRANYAEVADRVALENLAIADRDGELPFYHLVSPAPADLAWLPDWYDGTGSFSREALTRHAVDIPDIEERIVERTVQALTFASLLARHGEPRVDLLVLDTEGYDFELLRTIDFAQHHPRLLVYEHFHLSPDDRAGCRAMIQAAGYRTMEEGFDTWCLAEGDPLIGTWDSLRPAIRGLSVNELETAGA